MDYTAKNHVPENASPDSRETIFKKDKPEQRGSKEVKEAADVGRAAYTEAVGLDEGAETTGRVSEVLRKSSENDGMGPVSSSKKSQVDPDKIRQSLLENLPSEEQMKRQIDREIRKEIDYLHKKAVKMLRSPGKMSYFEMTNLMKKIRDLKGLLIQLVKASLDTLKALWLRYVHGVM